VADPPATSNPGAAASSAAASAFGGERLIFALDFPTLDAAVSGARAVRGHVGVVKVGLELFCKHGPDAVAACSEAAAAPVFLDLKLHDIPATVGRSVSALRDLADAGARYLTVHTSGGTAMLRAAVEAAGGALDVVGVTVLTSLDAGDLSALGVDDTPGPQVERLARLGYEAGVRAYVCSPREAPLVRKALGSEARIITPGVRPAGSARQDQKRVTTPGEAIAGGADMLVVGRPIREAAEPGAAARAIAEEITAALEDR
jgi:orotidine-5'-phosphate decarboxylase